MMGADRDVLNKAAETDQESAVNGSELFAYWIPQN